MLATYDQNTLRGDGSWLGRLVRVGAVSGLLLLTVLALSMMIDVMHSLRWS